MMFMWLLYLCFVSNHVWGLDLDNKAKSENATQRIGKQLSVFTVVKFPNNAVCNSYMYK